MQMKQLMNHSLQQFQCGVGGQGSSQYRNVADSVALKPAWGNQYTNSEENNSLEVCQCCVHGQGSSQRRNVADSIIAKTVRPSGKKGGEQRTKTHSRRLSIVLVVKASASAEINFNPS